jgi:hypothetical protein
VAGGCEHGVECHDGTEPSAASAPEASRAWLLVEHSGPWPAEAAEAELPDPLAGLVAFADSLGIRVQLIRRPGRRPASDVRSVFTGWTAGGEPWLRHGQLPSGAQPSGAQPSGAQPSGAQPSGALPCGPGPAGLDLRELDLKELAAGIIPAFGAPVAEPVYLVCAHARRDACCARFGAPLAQALATRYPGQVWETTHVGGHRFAANLVILPHGLYYGPVGVAQAAAAIDAYADGTISPLRYRGRAGQPKPEQQAEYERLASG